MLAILKDLESRMRSLYRLLYNLNHNIFESMDNTYIFDHMSIVDSSEKSRYFPKSSCGREGCYCEPAYNMTEYTYTVTEPKGDNKLTKTFKFEHSDNRELFKDMLGFYADQDKYRKRYYPSDKYDEYLKIKEQLIKFKENLSDNK